MNKAAKYDDEELEILQAWEAGALKPVADMVEHGVKLLLVRWA